MAKDYISREAASERLHKLIVNFYSAYEKDGKDERLAALLELDLAARSVVNAIPAADVAPVVLCRDCKHKGWVQEPEHGKSVDYCRLIERCVDKQFFCAAGERKDGDGE